MLKFLVAIIMLTWNAAYSDNTLIPEQIHLAFGNTPDTMSVQWATMDTFCSSNTKVWYGQDKNLPPPPSSYTVDGSCYQFNVVNRPTLLKQSHHVANMTKLTASTKYFYKVGDGINWSSTYSFTTAPNALTLSSTLPQKFIIVGDMGSSSSTAYKPSASPTKILSKIPTCKPSITLTTSNPARTVLPWITTEVHTQRVDMILHLGDYAYDLFSENGYRGRLFMNEIANSSSYVPYMVNVGNHEDGFNFAFYNEFFRNMPAPIDAPVVNTGYGNTPNNWYYSWNVGLIHFVTLSSEVYYNKTDLIDKQYKWLENDLQNANKNRTAAPWIIVNAHRGLYCSSGCDTDPKTTKSNSMRKLEPLLYKYGVDLYLSGHVHNYERMFDIYQSNSMKRKLNPPSTVYILVGNGGTNDNKDLSGFGTSPKQAYTAFRDDTTYGYSRIAVYNSTHLHWEQMKCNLNNPTSAATVLDSFWLVQFNHGSFFTKAPTVLPTKTPIKIPTAIPIVVPTKIPTIFPTILRTKSPTAKPTKSLSPSRK